PSYEWQPSADLLTRVPSLALNLFSHTLSEEKKKTLVECYSPIVSVQYSPSFTIPMALQKFSALQKLMDASLSAIQYSSMAIFCPCQ
ncbi:hypothetical protein J3Q64DRAFT_1637576, partial [Phycomyces blakesleeanus]